MGPDERAPYYAMQEQDMRRHKELKKQYKKDLRKFKAWKEKSQGQKGENKPKPVASTSNKTSVKKASRRAKPALETATLTLPCIPLAISSSLPTNNSGNISIADSSFGSSSMFSSEQPTTPTTSSGSVNYYTNNNTTNNKMTFRDEDLEPHAIFREGSPQQDANEDDNFCMEAFAKLW